MSILDWLSSVLGTYTPVSYDVYDVSSDTVSHVIPSGLAGVDWPYILTALFLLVVVWSVFRILGGIICRRS